MDAIFLKLIRNNLEVYIDDKVVKTSKGKSHAVKLKDILELVRDYNMHQNLVKYSFSMKLGKFLSLC